MITFQICSGENGPFVKIIIYHLLALLALGIFPLHTKLTQYLFKSQRKENG